MTRVTGAQISNKSNVAAINIRWSDRLLCSVSPVDATLLLVVVNATSLLKSTGRDVNAAKYVEFIAENVWSFRCCWKDELLMDYICR